MFKIICFLALASAAYAASVGSTADHVSSTTEKREVIPLLKYETDHKPDGSFHFSYEGGDNTFREESGVLENVGTDEEALEVTGSYRYIDSDGHEVEVHYTAGKNGFVPVGTFILPEISAAARAAADLPNEPVEEQLSRKGRSKDEKTAEPENIPVNVIAQKERTKDVKPSAKVEKTIEKEEKKSEKPEEKTEKDKQKTEKVDTTKEKAEKSESKAEKAAVKTDEDKKDATVKKN